MAGSEKSGFANAKAILIENAYFVLTPSEKSLAGESNCLQRFHRLLESNPDYYECQGA